MGVPVMAFGQTDYRHWAVTIDAREDVGAGFDRAIDTDWPFERFLYRFFCGQCLDDRREDWVESLFACMGAHAS